MHRLTVLPLLFLASLAGGQGHGDGGGKAPLFDNLGSHHHPVTTSSKQAQRYFDQGLVLCFAFNHPEAIRSFQEAARLDPQCAMAHWGIAFAYGANINLPMSEEAVPKAYGALKKALALAPKASAKERAYIQALAKRYAEKPPKDRAPLDRAFADAMREVVKQYPDDLDAATLFAEALMDTMPWNYWTEDGKPRPGTEELLATLESVLKRDPNHAGACHLYIHAVEASPHPERGLAAAHRLRDLVPGAGHLVHMPSHIYLRVGDYHEASRCNERAVAVDEAYIARYQVRGHYPAMYYTHNLQFLSYSTGMEGRSEDSLRAARKTAAAPVDKEMEHLPEMQWARATPLFALARFGRWEDVLREPPPGDEVVFVKAMWHYARGLTFVRLRKFTEAEMEAAALQKLAKDKKTEALETPQFPGASLVRIARTSLGAELAGRWAKRDAFLLGLYAAVDMQDKLPYMEPPYWYFPLRQRLGAALVEAGQFAKAEKVYREDLRRHPENGWSLFGLLQCLRAQGKGEAAEVDRRFRDAWKHADVTLTASSF
jgi:tetratricopeptide (TPR) repeat protein